MPSLSQSVRACSRRWSKYWMFSRSSGLISASMNSSISASRLGRCSGRVKSTILPLSSVESLLPDRRQDRDGVPVADSQPEPGRTDEDGGEVLEQQGDGGRGMFRVELDSVSLLLGATYRGRHDVHAEAAEFVLDGREALLGRCQLGDGDYDADVLFEDVPVTGDHRSEKVVVVCGGTSRLRGRVRQVQAQAGWSDDLVQKGLREGGQQVFLIGEVPVEHRRRFSRGRGDVGQRGAVKAPFGEQFSGRLFDGRPGLAAFGGKGRRGHQFRIRSPARNI